MTWEWIIARRMGWGTFVVLKSSAGMIVAYGIVSSSFDVLLLYRYTGVGSSLVLADFVLWARI